MNCRYNRLRDFRVFSWEEITLKYWSYLGKKNCRSCAHSAFSLGLVHHTHLLLRLQQRNNPCMRWAQTLPSTQLAELVVEITGDFYPKQIKPDPDLFKEELQFSRKISSGKRWLLSGGLWSSLGLWSPPNIELYDWVKTARRLPPDYSSAQFAIDSEDIQRCEYCHLWWSKTYRTEQRYILPTSVKTHGTVTQAQQL